MVLRGVVTAMVTLGVGKIPMAPGTWGSLLALLGWWAMPPLSPLTQGILILLIFLMGWMSCHFYEKWQHKQDPKEVVVDEWVGMWISLFSFPKEAWILALGFLFFRLFDIWKPFPVGWIDEKLPGALGTMLDDVAAGLLAWSLLLGIISIFVN